MTQPEKIYLEWYKFAKGFDGHLNAQDMRKIDELHKWLDSEDEQFRKFLFTISENPEDRQCRWLLEEAQELVSAIAHKRADIRGLMMGKKKSSGGLQKARPINPPTQEEINFHEQYKRDQEEYKAWVLMVRAKRKELLDRNWMPSSVTPSIRNNPFYLPSNRVDGRPLHGIRPDAELPDGVTRIN